MAFSPAKITKNCKCQTSETHENLFIIIQEDAMTKDQPIRGGGGLRKSDEDDTQCNFSTIKMIGIQLQQLGM